MEALEGCFLRTEKRDRVMKAKPMFIAAEAKRLWGFIFKALNTVKQNHLQWKSKRVREKKKEKWCGVVWCGTLPVTWQRQKWGGRNSSWLYLHFQCHLISYGVSVKFIVRRIISLKLRVRPLKIVSTLFINSFKIKLKFRIFSMSEHLLIK